jgi:hypothetical protein
VPHARGKVTPKRKFKEKRHTTILRYNYRYGRLYGKLWDIIKITSISAAGEK